MKFCKETFEEVNKAAPSRRLTSSVNAGKSEPNHPASPPDLPTTEFISRSARVIGVRRAGPAGRKALTRVLHEQKSNQTVAASSTTTPARRRGPPGVGEPFGTPGKAPDNGTETKAQQGGRAPVSSSDTRRGTYYGNNNKAANPGTLRQRPKLKNKARQSGSCVASDGHKKPPRTNQSDPKSRAGDSMASGLALDGPKKNPQLVAGKSGISKKQQFPQEKMGYTSSYENSMSNFFKTDVLSEPGAMPDLEPHLYDKVTEVLNRRKNQIDQYRLDSNNRDAIPPPEELGEIRKVYTDYQAEKNSMNIFGDEYSDAYFEDDLDVEKSELLVKRVQEAKRTQLKAKAELAVPRHIAKPDAVSKAPRPRKPPTPVVVPQPKKEVVPRPKKEVVPSVPTLPVARESAAGVVMIGAGEFLKEK